MRSVLVSAVSAAFVAVAVVWGIAQPAGAATEEIETGLSYYCAPSFMNGVCTTTITEGDTVTWDVVLGIHTVTECDSTYTTCPVAGGFDSGVLEEGETFSQTFDVVGDYAYYCTLHPTEQRGVIAVVAVVTSTPAPTPEPTPDLTEGASPTTSPAAVPKSGGEPPTDRFPPQALFLAFAGALAVAGAASIYGARRT